MKHPHVTTLLLRRSACNTMYDPVQDCERAFPSSCTRGVSVGLLEWLVAATTLCQMRNSPLCEPQHNFLRQRGSKSVTKARSPPGFRSNLFRFPFFLHNQKKRNDKDPDRPNQKDLAYLALLPWVIADRLPDRFPSHLGPLWKAFQLYAREKNERMDRHVTLHSTHTTRHGTSGAHTASASRFPSFSEEARGRLWSAFTHLRDPWMALSTIAMQGISRRSAFPNASVTLLPKSGKVAQTRLNQAYFESTSKHVCFLRHNLGKITEYFY